VDAYESLQQATASALRQVIGHTSLDETLTTGRETVRQQVFDLLTTILNVYQTGLVVTDVTVQPAKAPDEVKDAFDDAIKAQEDEQRYINQAQAYARGVEPIAKGKAQRYTQEANAYKKEVILAAKGDVARYLSILPEYLHAPLVTRQRMYLDTVQSVLSSTSKVLIDTQGGNLMYLPLDKIIQSNLALSDIEGTEFSNNQQESSITEAPLKSSTINRSLYRKGRS
jgi:membrane protease subunit HflK